MICVVITNLPSEAAAMALGKKLIDGKLIACSNIKKVTSQYYWQGKYYEEAEYEASFKTTLGKKTQAIKFIKNNHPYEVPMILSSEYEVSNTYKAWMDETLA